MLKSKKRIGTDTANLPVFTGIRYYFSIFKEFIGRRMYLVFVLTALAALAESFGIALILPLIEVADAGDVDGEMSSATAVLMSVLNTIGIGNSLVAILLFIGAVFIGKGLLKFSEGAYLSYLKSQLMIEIKGKMFDKYSTMDYSYYSEKNTGHFVNIINGQISNFIKSFESFKQFLTMIIMTVVYFSVAMILAWNFALMAVVLGAVLLYLFRWLNNYVRRLSIKTAEETTTLNKFLVQSIQSFKYLASTAQMNFLKKGVIQSIKKLANYQLKRGIANAFTNGIKEPVSVLFLLLVIILQVTLFDSPIAPIFVALLLFHRGMQQLVGIQSKWQATMYDIGSLEMVIDEFENVDERQEPTGSTKIPALSKGIDFRDVSFAYNKDDGDVLKDIDLQIPVNRTVAFVGESGAGKSTLIDMMTLMLRPRKGEIYIDDVPGGEINRESWRSQIGYVSQETVVFDDTIANNINLWKGDYSNDPDVRNRVREAAEKAYALKFIEEMPEGFNTIVGDRGIRLSGGQRQRLFIARELYKQPNLLILDEATSALDSDSENYIQQSIDNLKGSMTVMIIAHRLSTIKNADYIYVMDHGKIIEHGSYEDLTMVTNGRFKEMIELQSL